MYKEYVHICLHYWARQLVKWSSQSIVFFSNIENKNYQENFTAKERIFTLSVLSSLGKLKVGSRKLRIWRRACKSNSLASRDISCWRDGEHRSATVIWANLFTSDCKSPQCIQALDPSEMSSSTYRCYQFTGFFFLSEIKTLCISEKKSVYTTKWFHIWWNSSCHSVKQL